MSEKEREDLTLKADKLPEAERNHLLDTNTAKTIQETMVRYNLTKEQAVILAVLVRRVYLKDSARNQLTNEIMKYANVDSGKAQEIEQYLEENIFATSPTKEPERHGGPQTRESTIDLRKTQ